MRTVILLLLAACATTPNPYAYSGVMSKAECESLCAGYGYPILGVKDGACICDTSRCMRSKNHGGCEPLPAAP